MALQQSGDGCSLPVYFRIPTDARVIAVTVDDCYEVDNLRRIVTLSAIEGIRRVLFATCGAMVLTRVTRLFVQDGRAAPALGIACLALRAASGAMFIFALYRVMRLEKEGPGVKERRR